MSLRAFYAAILSILVTVAVLSLAWEFALEDWLLGRLTPYHEAEPAEERWEFVITTVAFSVIALIGPVLIGTRIIRRERGLQERLIRLSREDHLTGLLNRRRITELLDDEIQRAARYGTVFSLILMDIDHFKAINDRLGHQAGDEVLKMIAGVIKAGVRAADFTGRWGGEEFVILSPETQLPGGVALAEKIRARLEASDLAESGRQTASFGVTSFTPHDDLESMLARVDAALYAAKRRGRNRVETMPADADRRPEPAPAGP